jgi:hypothetical protein
MSQNVAPSQPKEDFKFINLDTGRLTPYGVQTLEQIFNQVAAGPGVVPCEAVTTGNVIALRPRMHREGARIYGQHFLWAFTADATTSAAVTAFLTDGINPLATIKVFKTNGAAQAGLNDIIAGSSYLLLYDGALDGGNGGLVLK